MGNQGSQVYRSVRDIPEGTAPPSLGELNAKVKEVALQAVQKFDPVELKSCQHCSRDPSIARRKDEILADLSTYEPEYKAFAEKTYQFRQAGAPDLWVSSTLNSDHTLSYWFQYPILPFHIQAAFVAALNLPITADNMHAVTERFPAVYTQLLKMNRNEVAKCEQIEPLYVDVALKTLLSRGYQYHQRKPEVE